MRTDKGSFKLRAGVSANIMPAFDLSQLGERRGASQSGNERNHLFLNQSGQQFVDISGLSGSDTPADTRAFAILDYDRDGWQDMVTANANAPLMLLYRNQLGDGRNAPAGRSMIAVRFVGGNHTDQPTAAASCRNGYGAVVTVALEDSSLLREHRCGEGLAAQNSATMIIGLGRHTVAGRVTVRWPSGIEQSTAAVAAGTLLTVFEDPAQSPTGAAFVSETYAVPRATATMAATSPAAEVIELPSVDSSEGTPDLVMYTTMATWCVACRGELPLLQHLRASFGEDQLRMFGVPVDAKEGTAKLEAYAAELQPPYRLLSSLPPEEIAVVVGHLKKTLHVEALPATVVTDHEGRVLLSRLGAPSVSELRKLLRR